jgi:primosomal protein N' (replication factor Y)
VSLIHVALDVPLPQLFTYRAAATADDVGRRVVVPFGPREAVGIILAVGGTSDLAEGRLRSARRIVREEPALDADVLDLIRFCAEYYQHPVGEVCAAVLPTALRQPKATPATAEHFRLTAAGRAADLATLPARALIKRRLMARLAETDAVSLAEVRELSPRGAASLKTLCELGWVEPTESTAAAPLTPAPATAMVPASGPVLMPEQAAALARMRGASEGFHAWLLFGVTGSGKTEVYLQLIADALARGRQTLVLVPEINLTPQLEERFRLRFPGALLVTLHSKLAGGERLAQWRLAQQGQAQIVLGTRLAVFAPLPALGLVIVDEEHDGSFKQGEGLRYSARDLAVFRARQRGVPIVLGSATPSLETFYNAERERYTRLDLPTRARGAPPAIGCIDTRTADLVEGLSRPLLDAVAATRARGEQSLLFINRRGYAPVLVCRACGWVAPCHRCSARLVFHTDRHGLRCHHCGHREPAPVACPTCGGQELVPVGAGTQRIEEALVRLMPEARVLRIDRDATRRKGAWSDLRTRIESGAVDVLVGTQMLAKGHDFPNLSLVGVLNADSALYSTDLRAPERLFALLTQVAGRAGRGDAPGRVLVQTEFPQHPFYRALIADDYAAYARQLLEERRSAGFPPFAAQALLRAEAASAELALVFLRDAARQANALGGKVEIYDPVPAGMARIAGVERAQLLVQSTSRPALQHFLARWRVGLDAAKERRVRWSLDVDPVEF